MVARRALGAWRRSILVRVVTATLLLSFAAVALLGQLVVSQVRDGLLGAKTDAALAHADAGLRVAEQRLASAPRDETANVSQLLTAIVTELSAQAGTSLDFGVVLLPSQRIPGQPATGRGPRTSGGITLSSVPQDLRTAVARNPVGRSYRYVPMRYTDSDAVVPGIAVGTQLSVPGAADYQLYYLFPLTEEEQTLNLVRSTLATVGVLFILVLAGVAYVVTRSVVTPVRIAARTAERIAAGSLQERMPERGEDDLARLASSFNEMTSALQRQIRQLEDLSRLQVRFVSDVSHELRTPLTTVRMAADVLYDARTSFDGTMGRAAELLHNELGRFEALLSDLLEISRFDAGVAVLDAEPVDLRRLARRTASAMRPLADRVGSKVRCQLPRTRCVAEVDPRRIERILRNLLTNAIEHGEGREIIVRVAANESAVAIAVRDHGVGLDPGQTGMVFNRFWRADPARARTTGGTGLGLAISQEDAQLHGGWLQAWGRRGDGAQFRLTVPRSTGGEIDRSPIPLEPADLHRGRELAGKVHDEV